MVEEPFQHQDTQGESLGHAPEVQVLVATVVARHGGGVPAGQSIKLDVLLKLDHLLIFDDLLILGIRTKMFNKSHQVGSA